MPRHSVYVRPEARREIDRLPGNVMQRVRREVLSLQDDPNQYEYLEELVTEAN